MRQELNRQKPGSETLRALLGIGAYLNKSTVEAKIRELINVRVSQMNSCTFCMKMHYEEARAKGETRQRLEDLRIWREAWWYSDRERAALALAEDITNCNVSHSVYKEVEKLFSGKELIDLTLIITTINTWNRINNAFVSKLETYRVRQFEGELIQ